MYNLAASRTSSDRERRSLLASLSISASRFSWNEMLTVVATSYPFKDLPQYTSTVTVAS